VPRQPLIDGRSIVPLLKSESDRELSERDLFWHCPHYGNQGGDRSSIIRRGDWKLIYYHEDGHDELYNLESDPGEQNDVLSDNRHKAPSFTGAWTAGWSKSTRSSPLPTRHMMLRRRELGCTRRSTLSIWTRIGSPTKNGGEAR
jgi:hypothetical protein